MKMIFFNLNKRQCVWFLVLAFCLLQVSQMMYIRFLIVENEKSVLAYKDKLAYSIVSFNQLLRAQLSTKDSLYVGIYYSPSNCEKCNLSAIKILESKFPKSKILYFIKSGYASKTIYAGIPTSQIRNIDDTRFFNSQAPLIFLVVGAQYFYPFAYDGSFPELADSYILSVNKLLNY